MAIRQKGTKWQVDVTVAGVRAPRVSCDTQAEAKKVEAEFRAALLRGVPPNQLAPAGPAKGTAKGTISELVDITYRTRWAGTKAEDNALRNADAWALEWGRDFPVTSITPAAIADVVDAWAAKGSANGTINRKIAALSVMLNVAEERGLIDKKPKLHRKKEYEGRLRYFTDDEAESLIEWAIPDMALHRLFILALETGLRQGELLTLTKRDVDLKHGIILLGETKGNKRRSVPLTRRAADAAGMMMNYLKDHERLFPDRITRRHISRVIAGWKHSRGFPADDEACFHTFRHTTCSRLVQRGVPLTVVQKFMGHANIQTTMNYAHLAPDSLDQARVALERTAA